MPGKVFISCGQHTTTERQIAQDIATWLQRHGFSPYVAIQAQSIQDVNAGIIGRLRDSDYYIFIDFEREKLPCGRSRGSLFTNQELAIAYVMGFDQVLFLRHRNIRLEGIAAYILSNAKEFDDPNDVPAIIKNEVAIRSWSPSYSRHLIVESSQWHPQAIFYGDHPTLHGQRWERILHVRIRNCRHDKGAIQTTARLSSITNEAGNRWESPDLNDLKWAGQVGYARTIRPGDSERIDAFALDANHLTHVYLHSAADVIPRQPILTDPGVYILHYQVFSQEFPLLEFNIRLNLTGIFNTTTAELV